MRKIANIFMILFGFAALLQLLDEGVFLLAGLAPLANFNSFMTILCGLFGLLLFFGFALQQQLPKSILVPLMLALAWGLLDYWPLAPVIGQTYALVAALAELLLLTLLFELNLRRNKQSRLVVASQFIGPGFSWRNLQHFILFSVPCLPLLALLLVFSFAATLVAQYSAGFIRLQPNGLYMSEKTYQKESKTIRLVSMIHLGQREYYQALVESIGGERVLVLAEGVKDSSGRLQGEFSYVGMARLLGLTAQEAFPFVGRIVTPGSLTELEDLNAATVDILPADIDLREFDPRTIAVLNALNRYLLGSESLASGYQDFSRWAAEYMSPETNRIIMQDLVDKRNAVLLSYLPPALAKYDILIVPWGAQHMAGLELAVTAQGFHLQRVQERLSVDFLELPYRDLWQLVWDNAAAQE